MKRQKFVYNAHAGDNTNFVYKELYASAGKNKVKKWIYQ